MVVSVAAGIYTGVSLFGESLGPLIPQPQDIIFPTFSSLWQILLRTTLGFSVVLATKVIVKKLCYRIASTKLKKDLAKSEFSFENRDKILVDLIYKYMACFAIGIDISYTLPHVFQIFGIDKATFLEPM